ncbi:MAG: DUF2804 family protein [Acutalibacteraceae bacterium]
MDFKKVLSDKRIPIPTPENIIDKNGKAVFGTFQSEFENLNLLDIKGQSKLPDILNKFRLTIWEAIEVDLKEVSLLTAVCDMGLIRVSLTCIYEKKTGKVTYWEASPSKKDAKVCSNLLKGATTFSTAKNVKIKCINHFEQGKAYLRGQAYDMNKGFVSYDLDLERASLPSVVSIPFGENKPLYTQKDLFKVKGYIELNGKRYEADEDSAAIIDDHKGYYPYIAHYDWVTAMGTKVIDGKKQYFGFNLTRNQSVNQTEYNENLIWFEGKTSRMTPVRFEHIEYNKWKIRDVYSMVDITFDIDDRYIMRMPYLIVDANYHITFGKLSGYICDEDGNKYILDGMTGIGEDKTIRF